ncbi:MAG: type VI secretion system ATPase TssH [bacterium]|nr:type VI secretion system ATPase TssH [bacterium]RIK51464.1 MAG: type VI secretion system ATPase TssH [Candidatus Microgenomates bacterium]
MTDQKSAISLYTTNLTARAKEGKIDPVIGRDNEVRRVMQVLSRRTKNNPVLVGDPGVGKTAIVEGLASRIVSGDVPDSLKDKELLVIDISTILAGAKFRGEFEERLKALLKEIDDAAGKYVLFIDELHTIVGAGGAEGAVDAGNMLKPALARGQLHMIGATTLNEYRKYIEKDAALERRFQPVMVEEPSLEDSIAILRGLKEKYEIHHGIRITDDALISAVTLSSRYIADRFLPDKAIDLVDEAASALKIETESLPTILDIKKRSLTQKEIELTGLKKEKSESSKAKATELAVEIASLKAGLDQELKSWQEQKELLSSLVKLQKEKDVLKLELETAEREVNLQKAAEIKYGRLPDLDKKLTEAEQAWKKVPTDKRLIKEEVSEDDIASVVSRWTGIPVTRLVKSETEKLLNLETVLSERVIGQSEATNAVARAIRRSRSGISDSNRPIATFLFLGPTGVGKTETAKALATELFGTTDAIVRLDMSEYSEEHNIARLIGAPPGYIGYEEGGQLTEAVRRHPYSVVLLDEIEKAHPTIYNTFLQIFDDGRLTDGKGRTINFTNTIIIMTSNLPEPELKNYFRPELLNRLDQVIVFNRLKPADMDKIVENELSRALANVESSGIKINIDDQVKTYLAKKGYDATYGARPLKRLIQNELLDELALKLLDSSRVQNPSYQVSLDSKSGKLIVHDA